MILWFKQRQLKLFEAPKVPTPTTIHDPKRGVYVAIRYKKPEEQPVPERGLTEAQRQALMQVAEGKAETFEDTIKDYQLSVKRTPANTFLIYLFNKKSGIGHEGVARNPTVFRWVIDLMDFGLGKGFTLRINKRDEKIVMTKPLEGDYNIEVQSRLDGDFWVASLNYRTIGMDRPYTVEEKKGQGIKELRPAISELEEAYKKRLSKQGR